MKKFSKLLVAAIVCGMIPMSAHAAKTAAQLRVYINPGHGAWCSNCRPQDVIKEVGGTIKTIKTGASTTTGAKPDTTAFYESNTNLWKCLAIVDKLEQYGLKIDRTKNKTNSNKYKVGAALDFTNNICMSRTKSGPYPVDNSNTVCNKNLSTICAEANANNFDMFISVHSNANVDPSEANYLAIFFRGWSRSGGDIVSGSRSMAKKAWPHLFSISHHKWTARLSADDNQGVLGDITFYQSGSSTSTGYLGALRHNVPGYLAEGYFHTYRPARQRHMQRKVNVIEGYMYARGVADYFGLTKESTGDIYGVIRSKTEKFNNSWYSPKSTTPDVWKPLNGVTVIVKKDGVEKQRMTTDNFFNGAFVFTNLPAGTYTIEMSKTGYKTTTATCTVTAAKTACPELYMEPGEANALKSAPLNNLTEKWNFSDKKGTDVQTGFDAKLIRNFCYSDGKLYCVYNHSQILVLNAQTGAMIGFLDNGDVVNGGTLKLCDVKAIDGHIIACNLAAAANNEILRLYCWDNDNEPAKLLKTVSDLRGCARLGDCMELSGSFDGDMYLTFCNDNGTLTQVIDMYRLAGKNWNANKYSVLNPEGSNRLGTSSTTRAYRGNGGFWVDGFNVYPTWCTLNSAGNLIAQTCIVTNSATWGTGMREFKWKNDNYNACMMFNASDGNAAHNFTGGRVRLTVNNAGNYQSPITVAEYPAGGLSDNNKNGNTTTDCAINTDGSNYIELWVNSTNQGICYYSYGNVPSVSTDPILSCGIQSLAFTAEEGQSDTKSVTVTGRNLVGSINAAISGTDASKFAIDKTTLASGESVNITYTGGKVGTHSAVLTFTSGNAIPVKVNLTGTTTEHVDFVDQIEELAQGWIVSETAGNIEDIDWASGSGNTTRDIQFLNGKLYAANNGASTEGCAVFAIDPYSGQMMTPISTNGISGGRLILGGLSAIGDKLIASNSALSSHALKVYKWDNDDADPELWFSDATHGGVTIGDQINTSGTMEDGYIWFSNGQIVLRYKVTNGTVNTTAEQITLSDNGTATNAGMADVTPLPDGRFWVTGSQSGPKLYEADGTYIATLISDADNAAKKSQHQGTSLDIVYFGSRVFAVRTTYLGEGVNAATDTLKDGAVEVIDITDAMASLGLSRATNNITGHSLGFYPPQGLGSTRNTQIETAVTYEIANNGTMLNIWGCVTLQGLTYCSYDGAVGSSFLRGDVNGDREVNSADLGALINIIIGVAPSNERADVNNDESVTSADLGALINIIIGN